MNPELEALELAIKKQGRTGNKEFGENLLTLSKNIF
jgi:hypothetical protein